MGNFILSQGKTTFYMYLFILQAILGFPMGYLLIMNFGVIGLIVTTLITQLLVNVIMLYWIRIHYGLTVDWVSSVKILLSSAVAASLTYVLILELRFSSFILLILGVVFFIVVFLAATLLTRTISKSDIENLRGMISGLGSIGKIINKVLNILEKMVNFLKH